MFKWVKCWAVDLAMSYAKKYATIDTLSSYAVDLCDTLISRAVNGETNQARLAKICDTCEISGEIFVAIARALKDGKITIEESQEITQKIYRAFNTSPLTDDKLAGYLDMLAGTIKGKL